MINDNNAAERRKFLFFGVKHHPDALKSTSIVTIFSKFPVQRQHFNDCSVMPLLPMNDFFM